MWSRQINCQKELFPQIATLGLSLAVDLKTMAKIRFPGKTAEESGSMLASEYLSPAASDEVEAVLFWDLDYFCWGRRVLRIDVGMGYAVTVYASL